MIASRRTPPDRRRLWAAERLAADPESAPEKLTVAMLRRVEESEFVPAPFVRQAWEVALDKAPHDPLPLAHALEEELQTEVERFARKFFDLSVAERSAAWQQLSEQTAGFPRLRIRLENLRGGLTVEFPAMAAQSPETSPETAKLIAFARELFVLPPAARAVRRREILREEMQRSLKPWQSAARSIRWRQRKIAELSPDLIMSLASSQKAIRRAARNDNFRRVQPVKVKSKPMSRPRIFIAIVVVVFIYRIVVMEVIDNRHDLEYRNPAADYPTSNDVLVPHPGNGVVYPPATPDDFSVPIPGRGLPKIPPPPPEPGKPLAKDYEGALRTLEWIESRKGHLNADPAARPGEQSGDALNGLREAIDEYRMAHPGGSDSNFVLPPGQKLPDDPNPSAPTPAPPSATREPGK